MGGAPIQTGDAAIFQLFSTRVRGTLELGSEVKLLNPGEGGEVTVNLSHSVAVEEGLHFAIIVDGKTVGAGTVTSTPGSSTKRP